MDQTRLTLFERLAAKSTGEREQAWQEFHTIYVPIISGFARRCGASRQDIDDIVQDVVAAFVQAQPEFQYDPKRGRFRGYLKTITVRAAIRRSGKNLKFRGIPLEELADIEAAVEPLWDDLWEQQLVEQAILILRSQNGESLAFKAFEQHVLLDHSAEVVAAHLGTTVNNVHQAKSRVTKQLRETVERLRANQ